MGVPKRKTSKRAIRTRRHAHSTTAATTQVCPQCQAPKRPHRVCPACGFYDGRQVLAAAAKE
jgi:large subunit ribosomal protein L32